MDEKKEPRLDISVAHLIAAFSNMLSRSDVLECIRHAKQEIESGCKPDSWSLTLAEHVIINCNVGDLIREKAAESVERVREDGESKYQYYSDKYEKARPVLIAVNEILKSAVVLQSAVSKAIPVLEPFKDKGYY